MLSVPHIAISATGRTPGELLECARRALEHSRLVELRLDWVANPLEALPLIPRLLEEHARRPRRRNFLLQATCRREEAGGRFAGSISSQLELLSRAAAAGCRMVDLEIESAEAAGREAVAALRREALLILSFHDFSRTPRLEPAARRLCRFPADFYKLIPTATRQSDNCTVLDFLSAQKKAQSPERWIAFAMGEAGVPSRALALSRGSALVYAACPPEAEGNAEPAAPGQLDSDTLRNRYRAEKLSPQSAVYGLLGSPVRQSVGAAVHNAVFRARRCDAVYLPLLATDLRDFRKAAQRYPLAGFSVTIPHKQSILRFVDKTDRTVRAVGAANTVRVRGGRWEATNTDVEGIVTPLRKVYRLGVKESWPSGFRAVIVGTGGAARAAVAALRQLRCREISITGRTPAHVQRLARDVGGRAIPLETLPTERFDLLIHATSAGMWPHAEESFLRPQQITANVVFDLVYNPIDTRLLQTARSLGCRTISGLEMYLAQAARQLEYWTGQEAPLRLMRQTAVREVERLQQAAVAGH